MMNRSSNPRMLRRRSVPDFSGRGRPSKSLPIIAGISALLVFGSRTPGAETQVGAHFRKDVQPLLVEFCYDCHGDGMNKGKVAFDELKSDEELLDKRDLWWAALKNLRAGLMPPEKKPRQ